MRTGCDNSPNNRLELLRKSFLLEISRGGTTGFSLIYLENNHFIQIQIPKPDPSQFLHASFERLYHLRSYNWVIRSVLGNTKPDLFCMTRACEVRIVLYRPAISQSRLQQNRSVSVATIIKSRISNLHLSLHCA